jgi:hypothetical protein
MSAPGSIVSTASRIASSRGPLNGEVVASRSGRSGVISTAESAMTRRSSPMKSAGRSPGRSRTSSSALASGGITLVLSEPRRAVMLIVFRRIAL